MTAEELKAYLLKPEIKGLIKVATLEKLAEVPRHCIADYIHQRGRVKGITAENLAKITEVLNHLKF